MYKVTKAITFCYGHRLLDYKGKCRTLHGHNGKVEIELFSKNLNKTGMVLDFTQIKNIIEEWIEDNLDHKMLLSKDDPIVEILRKNNEDVYIMESNPTAEAIAKLIYDYAVSRELPVNEVRFWETENSFAVYDGKSEE